MPNHDHTHTIQVTPGSMDNIYVTADSSMSFTYPSDGHVTVSVASDSEGIHPRLYFKYVKSKLTKLEQSKLKKRISKLQKMVKDTKELGQQALYEDLSKMLAITVRECEAEACGLTTWISDENIQKFRGKVKEEVFFSKLDEFPRLLPSKVKKRLAYCQKRALFDEYWILYLDYSGEGPKKTNKEKIREKDPILFGKYAYSDKYYYIIDWVDEYCDLTLDKFVEKMKENDEEYELDKIPEMDSKLMDRLKQEVKDRYDRLQNTRQSNFRGLMVEEDKVNQGKSWWEKLLFWKK